MARQIVIRSGDDLGLAVAEARAVRRLSQQELADQMGIDRTCLARLENGLTVHSSTVRFAFYVSWARPSPSRCRNPPRTRSRPMARVRELGVWLRGERVATLRAPRVGRVSCEYTADAIVLHGSAGVLLSCSLPVRTGKRDVWPFVTGLLPEGQLSVAGIQDKMLLVRLDDGRWARPTHGYPSTHILKLDDRVHAGLVRAEHAEVVARSERRPESPSRTNDVHGRHR